MSSARIDVGVLLAAAIAMACAMAAWVIRATARPLNEAVAIARAVASGDLALDFKADGQNETGQLLGALHEMKTRLATIVGDVRGNAEGAATAAVQIAQGNNDLSGRTEAQASALEQTAASMEELSSTVRQNADNARQANQLAQGASTVAVRGGKVVSQVVDTMRGINESSKQIKTLISASVQRVEQGSALVDQAGVTMTEVVASIRRVTDIVGEISAASSEQSNGVAQIGEEVTQMDKATQQNAALVEESAAAAESLKGQAQQLVDAVAVFKLAASAHRPDIAAQARPAPARVAVKPAQSAAPKAVTERRGPNRAKNVVRPSFAAPATSPATTVVVAEKTGTDDWESF